MDDSAARRSRRAVLAAMVVLALLAAACGGGGDTSESDAGPDQASADGGDGGEDAADLADRSGELVFANTSGFNSLDPHRPVGSNDKLWMRPIYDRLITYVQGRSGIGELAPQLATSWEFADDGLSVTFDLRDDVTFQDGASFDANAVKANIERAMGPESTVASEVASISRVEVVDDARVVFHLKQPDPSLPWSLAIGTSGMMISPDALGTDLTAQPVGSGPFELVSAQKDADVVYERWDGHWDPDAALVQKLTISTIPDLNVRYNGSRAGEYDIATLQAPLDVQAKALTAERFHWQQAFSPLSYGVLLHSGAAPFDDVRVRRAVSMAIDRSAISEELFNGVNPPAYQSFPEGTLGYDPSLDADPFDVEAARRLVEQAGARGAAVSMIQMTTVPNTSLAEVVQQALTDIGLEVELVPLSNTEARSAWRQGTYQAFVGPIIGQQDPSATLNLSYLGGDNPAPPPAELTEMADEARLLPVDSDEREQAYQEISAYLVENPVHVPIAQFSNVYLCGPEVVGCDKLSEIAAIDFRGVGVTSPAR